MTSPVIGPADAQDEPALAGVTVTELQPLIDAASVQIEDYLDSFVIQRSRTERRLLGQRSRHRFRSDFRVHLDKRPVASITSIQDDATPTANTLSLNEDYYLHLEQGTLESLHAGGFPEPVGFWNIVYVTGLYATRAEVDARIRQAAVKLVVGHRSRPNPAVTRERIGNLDLQYTSGGGAGGAELPGDVRALLDSVARVAV